MEPTSEKPARKPVQFTLSRLVLLVLLTGTVLYAAFYYQQKAKREKNREPDRELLHTAETAMQMSVAMWDEKKNTMLMPESEFSLEERWVVVHANLMQKNTGKLLEPDVFKATMYIDGEPESQKMRLTLIGKEAKDFPELREMIKKQCEFLEIKVVE